MRVFKPKKTKKAKPISKKGLENRAKTARKAIEKAEKKRIKEPKLPSLIEEYKDRYYWKHDREI